MPHTDSITIHTKDLDSLIDELKSTLSTSQYISIVDNTDRFTIRDINGQRIVDVKKHHKPGHSPRPDRIR